MFIIRGLELKNVTVEDFKADIAISFGPDCRAAEALRRNGIRFFSSPFDWMMRYNLEYIYDTLKVKGKNFGVDFKEDVTKNKKFRYMISESTGMISIHHFCKNISVEDAYFVFRYTMDKRFAELDTLFNNAENICIVSSRKIEVEDIKSFMDKFLKLYSFKKVCYINIFSTTGKELIEKHDFDNLTIYQCYFEDVHPESKNSKTNKMYWKGNVECWDKILSKISLNQNFVSQYHKEKKLRKLIPSDLKSAFKVCCINAKCGIFRLLKITCD